MRIATSLSFCLLLCSNAAALQCFSQRLYPDGTLPEKIAVDDWPSSAALITCNATDAVWCVQYYVQDGGNQWVSGGCLGEFIGASKMPPVSCNSSIPYSGSEIIPGFFGDGGSLRATFYCCKGDGCTAARQFPAAAGKTMSMMTIVILALVVIPAHYQGQRVSTPFGASSKSSDVPF